MKGAAKSAYRSFMEGVGDVVKMAERGAEDDYNDTGDWLRVEGEEAKDIKEIPKNLMYKLQDLSRIIHEAQKAKADRKTINNLNKAYEKITREIHNLRQKEKDTTAFHQQLKESIEKIKAEASIERFKHELKDLRRLQKTAQAKMNRKPSEAMEKKLRRYDTRIRMKRAELRRTRWAQRKL